MTGKKPGQEGCCWVSTRVRASKGQGGEDPRADAR